MSRTAWQRKAPDAYWSQGDTAPAISEQLLDGTGAVVDLTGAAVRFQGTFADSCLYLPKPSIRQPASPLHPQVASCPTPRSLVIPTPSVSCWCSGR